MLTAADRCRQAAASAASRSSAPPGHQPWAASWGTFLLCSTEEDIGIVLEDVRFTAPVQPLELSAWIRTVTRADFARGTATVKDSYYPFAMGAGSPPEFDEPYVKVPLRGSFEEGVSGVPVSHRCGSQPIEFGFEELVVTLTADRGGAQVSDVYVDYQADGAPMTLHIQQLLTACGPDIADVDEECTSLGAGNRARRVSGRPSP